MIYLKSLASPQTGETRSFRIWVWLSDCAIRNVTEYIFQPEHRLGTGFFKIYATGLGGGRGCESLSTKPKEERHAARQPQLSVFFYI